MSFASAFSRSFLYGVPTVAILSAAFGAAGFLGLKKHYPAIQRQVATGTRVISQHGLSADPRETLLELIGHSKTEILVSARILGWEDVLIALRTKARSGVRVVILFDAVANPNPDKGALGWVLQNRVGEVYVADGPLLEQSLATDGSYLAVSTLAWAPKASKLGTTYYIADPVVLKEFAVGYAQMLSRAKKLL